MPDAKENGRADKLQWVLMSAMAAIILALVGFSVSQVTARITVTETRLAQFQEDQTQINRAREAQLAELRGMAAQLERIEKNGQDTNRALLMHMANDKK